MNFVATKQHFLKAEIHFDKQMHVKSSESLVAYIAYYHQYKIVAFFVIGQQLCYHN